MNGESQFNMENFLRQNEEEISQEIDQFLNDVESGEFLKEGAKPFLLG